MDQFFSLFDPLCAGLLSAFSASAAAQHSDSSANAVSHFEIAASSSGVKVGSPGPQDSLHERTNESAVLAGTTNQKLAATIITAHGSIRGKRRSTSNLAASSMPFSVP